MEKQKLTRRNRLRLRQFDEVVFGAFAPKRLRQFDEMVFGAFAPKKRKKKRPKSREKGFYSIDTVSPNRLIKESEEEELEQDWRIWNSKPDGGQTRKENSRWSSSATNQFEQREENNPSLMDFPKPPPPSFPQDRLVVISEDLLSIFGGQNGIMRNRVLGQAELLRQHYSHADFQQGDSSAFDQELLERVSNLCCELMTADECADLTFESELSRQELGSSESQCDDVVALDPICLTPVREEKVHLSETETPVNKQSMLSEFSLLRPYQTDAKTTNVSQSVLETPYVFCMRQLSEIYPSVNEEKLKKKIEELLKIGLNQSQVVSTISDYYIVELNGNYYVKKKTRNEKRERKRQDRNNPTEKRELNMNQLPNEVRRIQLDEVHLNKLKSSHNIIFLDLDNWSMFEQLPGPLPPHTFVWAFMGAKTGWKPPLRNTNFLQCLKANNWKLNPKCAGTKDAADVALVWSAGRCDMLLPMNIPFCIISGDKAFNQLRIQFEECSRRTLHWLDPHTSTTRGLHAQICSVTQSFKPEENTGATKMPADPQPGTSEERPKTKEIFMAGSKDGVFSELKLPCAQDSQKLTSLARRTARKKTRKEKTNEIKLRNCISHFPSKNRARLTKAVKRALQHKAPWQQKNILKKTRKEKKR